MREGEPGREGRWRGEGDGRRWRGMEGDGGRWRGMKGDGGGERQAEK